VDLEAFELMQLRRPHNAPDFPEETIERIQAAGRRSALV
jgi:hypothetical protein